MIYSQNGFSPSESTIWFDRYNGDHQTNYSLTYYIRQDFPVYQKIRNTIYIQYRKTYLAE